MSFSLSELPNCDPICRACVKSYIKKHDLKRGDKFEIPCQGIKKQHLDNAILSGLADPETALSMYDPVLWAKQNLDWICVDPDGEEWKRKSEDGDLPAGFAYWTPKEARRGKSPFNRLYQAELLRCSSKRKVSRIGRQAGKSEALCIFILFKMFTERGYSVTVITPYQTQVELIYKRIFELLETKPELINAVKIRRKSPNHYVELHNSSSIKMFTAGTKSNAEAGVVRGAHANLLIFDEADMLSRGDLDSSLALIMNFPEAIVWMSSTPTGKRETFYKACLDNEYREFHYPSSVNPTWDDAKERFFRKGLTELGYVHEICLISGTKIRTRAGLTNVEDITTNDQIVWQDGQLYPVEHSAVNTGVSLVSRYATAAGAVFCTSRHKFPNREHKKVPICELEEVPVSHHFSYGTGEKDEVYARLIGWNLGDGSVCSTRYQASFYSSTKEDMENLRRDIQYLYPQYRGKVITDIVKNTNKTNRLVSVDGPRAAVNVSSKITQELIERGAVRGKKTEQEYRVPAFVRKGSQSVRANFLAAFFGAEGSTPRQAAKGGYIPASFCLPQSKRKHLDACQFFSDLIDLLKSFDIDASYTVSSQDDDTNIHLLHVKDKRSIYNFLRKIGYHYDNKKRKLGTWWRYYLEEYEYSLVSLQTKYCEARSLRTQGLSYKDIQKATGLTFSQVDKAINNDRYPKRIYRAKHNKRQYFPFFEEWLDVCVSNDTLFLKILNKTECPVPVPVWNFTAGTPDHSYLLANNLQTFNCADFGEDVQGVYQKKYIGAAQAEYSYGDLQPARTWIYSIGVDWNDNFGTVIRVLGLNPGDNCLYVVDGEIVKRDGWTQTDAVAKIVNMNRKWNPHYIYVDKGHGHAQVEFLHGIGARAMKKGGNKIDARLATIVKAYDFGSTVEVKDLFTKQPVKKPAKPFLVESSVRCFEDGRIKYPKEDEQYTSSLEGYHIVRRTDAGIPKYGFLDEAVGDHLIDATNLAIVAFALEGGELGNPKFVSTVAFSGQIGEHPAEKKEREARIDAVSKRTEDKEFGKRTSYTAMPASWPAANTSFDKQESGKIRIWSWPGWDRDAPPPKRKNSSRASRPRRTNI